MDDNLMKDRSQATNSRDSIELTSRIAGGEKRGTQSDEKDMDRMGKLQELRVCHKNAPTKCGRTHRDQRQFKFVTIFGFGVLLGNTWEFSMMYAAWIRLEVHN